MHQLGRAVVEHFASASYATLADVEHLGRFSLPQSGQLAGFFGPPLTKGRDLRRDQRSLAFVQVPPVQVQRQPHRPCSSAARISR